MVGYRATFAAELAPCGAIVGGECYREGDGMGLVVYDQYYACGCRRTRHEYHDGTVTTTATRHGGHARLVLEEYSEHPV
jgi:hypothetical protein